MADNKETGPQELYRRELYNYECMVSGDDEPALMRVVDEFGAEAAHTISRVYVCTPTNVLAPLTERDRHLGEHRHTMMMLGRLKFDLHGFFNSGDCRYHRPECLWSGNVEGQIAEMRKLYGRLPDDIRDESPMTETEIEDYARRLMEYRLGNRG